MWLIITQGSEVSWRRMGRFFHDKWWIQEKCVTKVWMNFWRYQNQEVWAFGLDFRVWWISRRICRLIDGAVSWMLLWMNLYWRVLPRISLAMTLGSFLHYHLQLWSWQKALKLLGLVIEVLWIPPNLCTCIFLFIFKFK